MTVDISQRMNEFVLEFPDERQSSSDDYSAGMYAVLSDSLLFENILWYCRFRWLMIAGLVLFGLLSGLTGWFEGFNLRSHLLWPFVIAGLLAFFNILFLSHAYKARASMPGREIRFNMWSQIIMDLLFLTGVVHYAGSLETPIAFTYLFHIVLACIFFSRLQSFLVTIFACIAFVSCVSLEVSGLLPSSSIFENTILLPGMMLDPPKLFIPVFSALAIWLVVWYLVSHLSELTRQRDIEIIETNRQLSEKQKEEKKHVMWLTHELKAPLAAIESNVLLIREGYCGVLPEKALEVVERISSRSHKLSHEIKEMLQLAHIRSEVKNTLQVESIDLSEIIAGCLSQLQPSADERNILLEPDLSTAAFAADP